MTIKLMTNAQEPLGELKTLVKEMDAMNKYNSNYDQSNEDKYSPKNFNGEFKLKRRNNLGMQNSDMSPRSSILGDSSFRTRSNVKLVPLENSSRKSYGMKIRAND